MDLRQTGLEKLAEKLYRRLGSTMPLVYRGGVMGSSVSVDEGVVCVVLMYGAGELLVFQMTLDAAAGLRDLLGDTVG